MIWWRYAVTMMWHWKKHKCADIFCLLWCLVSHTTALPDASVRVKWWNHTWIIVCQVSQVRLRQLLLSNIMTNFSTQNNSSQHMRKLAYTLTTLNRHWIPWNSSDSHVINTLVNTSLLLTSKMVWKCQQFDKVNWEHLLLTIKTRWVHQNLASQITLRLLHNWCTKELVVWNKGPQLPKLPPIWWESWSFLPMHKC